MTVSDQTAKVSFEDVVCPLCHTELADSMYRFEDSHGVYTIVRCKSCRFVYLNPRPEAWTIGGYYDAAAYTPFLSSSNRRSLFGSIYSGVRDFSVRWKRKKIERVQPKGSLLDIGCGTGEFLNEMTSHGWESCGVEPSPDASEFARRTFGLKVKTGFVTGDIFEAFNESFDLITMWHVLEHVHDLEGALRLIAASLKRRGLLVIAVPNLSSFDARAYGRDWIALDPPRHLWHFTPDTMSILAERGGFMIENRHQMPLDTVFNTFMSESRLVGKHGSWFWPLGFLRAVWRMKLSYLAGLKGNGSSMMYYLRKR